MNPRAIVPYIVYDTITGRILRTGSCYESGFSSLPQEATEGVLQGKANDLTQCVDLNTLEIVAKPEGFDPPETDYRVLRITHYPSLSDQIGAIMKGGEELDQMRQLVQSVKDRFPKSAPSLS